MSNPCPLISPERCNEILAHLPNTDGKIWSNDDHLNAARTVFTFLLECGVHMKDMYSIGLTLARISQP